jgi:hypothetical protein
MRQASQPRITALGVGRRMSGKVGAELATQVRRTIVLMCSANWTPARLCAKFCVR